MSQKSNGELLLPTLGMFTTVSIVVGAVIGSGIFKKPALMAMQLGAPELLLVVWVLAGLLTLFGALTNAEIAGMISATGGQYIYFREMYGDFLAYLYGWSMFAVVQTASIASITYVFSDAAASFFPLPRLGPELEAINFFLPGIGTLYPLQNFGVKALTAGVIIFLSLANYIGVAFGGLLQTLFTVAKVLAILIIVAIAFGSGAGSMAHFVSEPGTMFATVSFATFVSALTGALWAYDGWNQITYIAGEVRNPQRTIPRSLFLGMLVIIGIYVLVNLAYLYILPMTAMSGSELVAVDVIRTALKGSSDSLIVLAVGFVGISIMISTFGTSNATILSSARLFYAMSREKMFFDSVGKIHPKYRTPAVSLLFQCVWSAVLVFSGSFDQLTDMLVFVQWAFYALGAYGVFILRRKMPEVERPYKVWGYPFVPGIFVVVATSFVVFTLYNDITTYARGESQIINSVFGIVLVALGIPFYLYFRRRPR